MAAGTVYSLEAELNDLEECARGISSSTSDLELSYLEEQVATAAGKVKQSELQVGQQVKDRKILMLKTFSFCFLFLSLKLAG